MIDAPAAPELLRVWERERHSPPVQRALALLAAACPQASPEELAALSVGRRDALLLTLREQIFGPRLQCVVACASCAGELQFAFDVADIRVGPAAEIPLNLESDGYTLSFRLPCSQDLAAVAGEPGALLLLIGRCLLVAERSAQAVRAEDLPPDVVSALAGEMARADPQADVRFSLSCPDCGASWGARFDIGSHLWDEIEAWAYRALGEVHTLAAAYHWREADILALSPWRRKYYLELVQA